MNYQPDGFTMCISDEEGLKHFSGRQMLQLIGK